jgi:hypothetical protein
LRGDGRLISHFPYLPAITLTQKTPDGTPAAKLSPALILGKKNPFAPAALFYNDFFSVYVVGNEERRRR